MLANARKLARIKIYFYKLLTFVFMNLSDQIKSKTETEIINPGKIANRNRGRPSVDHPPVYNWLKTIGLYFIL